MSPKPEGLRNRPRMAEASTNPKGTSAVFHSEGKDRKKQELREYLRMKSMLGLEQHHFEILRLGPAHLLAAYITYLNVMGEAPWSTFFLFEMPFGGMAGLGVTVGLHRYWTHKTFKANLPLQYFLMIMQTIAFQNSIYKWCLDHRIHHKYTDTDADPHNSKRGFWFSHMGWLLLPKHPKLEEKLESFDMPDLENDPVVRFQRKWFWPLVGVFHFALPIWILHYFWGMPLLYCVAANARRHVASLHCTWSVNSVAHMWGDKPYDKSITSTNNPIVSLFAIGEGWHNYHHTFPWDYKASEWGWKINLSAVFIDFCAWMGWAYDLKTVSPKMLNRKLQRAKGEGFQKDVDQVELEATRENDFDFDHHISADVTELMKSSVEQPLWGWDDDAIPEEFRKMTEIISPKLY